MDTTPNDGNPIFLSVNLRVLRKQKGWSQEEFAEKVGLNRGNIASYEKGSAEPKICNLLKIAKTFRVSIIDLTKKDLRTAPPPEANTPKGTAIINSQDAELLDNLKEQTEEIETFVNSVYNCHCYRIKNCEEMPKEMKMVVSNMDELYQVTQKLLEQHKKLLQFIECKK